jgi:3-methyladenine DNA glycosylase/8-oxoguanine DNA glycosylase
MTRLTLAATLEIEPIPPYDFELTAKKPAGWPLFTPNEVYEKGILRTATHIDGELVGVKLRSKGTLLAPRVLLDIFTEKKPSPSRLETIEKSLVHSIGADEDLAGFYQLAEKDDILRLVAEDLQGMHNTESSSIFPDACLAIMLQMAPLKRSNEMMACLISKYGETANFDRRSIRVWPLPRRIAAAGADEMARTCKIGYRAKRLAALAERIDREGFPSIAQLELLPAEEAKQRLIDLPGIGDYSADIINPHGGFPIDVWSADVFGRLFFGAEPDERRKSIDRVKKEGLRRWGKWSWMAFFYVVQDLENLSRKLGYQLRLS